MLHPVEWGGQGRGLRGREASKADLIFLSWFSGNLARLILNFIELAKNAAYRARDRICFLIFAEVIGFSDLRRTAAKPGFSAQ